MAFLWPTDMIGSNVSGNKQEQDGMAKLTAAAVFLAVDPFRKAPRITQQQFPIVRGT